MWRKLIKLSLVIVLFLIIWSKISNSFDGDLGWHLRFGEDAFNHNFQYQDSYTYTFFGRDWTNHEWGGDLLFWFIYSRFGYYYLVMLVSLVLFSAFYLATKLGDGRTTIAGLIVAVFAAQASSHIFVMRLAMLAPLFFIIIWYSLRKIPSKNYFYLWPLLFWVWSALHGSWVFGFIVINIYLFGNLGQMILFRWSRNHPLLRFGYGGQAYPALAGIADSMWRKADFIKVILAQFFSILAVAINPYGLKILLEVNSYFSKGYFKSHITEWVTSYTYPVFWSSLAWSTVALFLAFILAYRRKLNLPELLLITALFISGWQYKRNVIFTLLAGIPLIAAVADYVISELQKNVSLSKILKQKMPKVMALACGSVAIVSLVYFYSMRVKIYDDVWTRPDVFRANVMPFDAAEFLKRRMGGETARRAEAPAKRANIFNEFNWGGFLNWELPEALVYLDGRGTATWVDPKNPDQTLLETYMGLRYEPGGLPVIEKDNVKYIFLRNAKVPVFPRPDWINKIIFGNELEVLVQPEITELNKDLDSSNNWKLIYNDSLTNIWERK